MFFENGLSDSGCKFGQTFGESLLGAKRVHLSGERAEIQHIYLLFQSAGRHFIRNSHAV